MKNETLTDAIGMIDEDMVLAAGQYGMIRQTRRKHRILGAAAAACAAVVLMTGAAYAYSVYHRESVQKYFGVRGEELIAGYPTAGDAVFANDEVSLTVDALLYDGRSAVAVVTLEALDPDYAFEKDNCYMPEIVCDAAGNAVEPNMNGEMPDGAFLSGYGAFSFWSDSEQRSNQCRFIMDFHDMADWDGKTLYMRYGEPDEEEYIYASREKDRTLLDGLMISLTFEKNCELYTLTAEDGAQVYLSDFELLVPADEAADVRQKASKLHGADYRIFYADGTAQQVYEHGLYIPDGGRDCAVTLATSDSYSDAAFTSVFRAEQITAVEINGVRYSR